MNIRNIFGMCIFILLVSTASAVTLDELLNSYDWSVDTGAITVNSITPSESDTNANTLFDEITYTLDITGTSTYDIIGYLGDTSAETSITGSGNAVLTFYSANLEQDTHNFSYTISENNNIIKSEYNTNPYTVTASHEPSKVIIQSITDTSLNLDGDGLYEALELDLALDTNVSGDYLIKAYIEDIEAQINTTLTEGQSNIQLQFSSKDIRSARLNGSLTINAIEFEGDNFKRTFERSDIITIDQTLFDPEAAIVTGSFTDRAIDTDADTLYNKVEIDFNIYANETKTYNIEASIDDSYNNHIADINHTTPLTQGNNLITIEFDTKKIKQLNGPYKVSFIKIQDNDFISDPYTITNLTHSGECDPLEKADLTVELSDISLTELGNNYAKLEVNVRNIGGMTAFKAPVEVYDNRSNLIKKSYVYFIETEKTAVFNRINIENTSELKVFVDLDDLVEEENESNNIIIFTTTMQASAISNLTTGSTPLSVGFTGSANGGNPTYTYHWDFGDNTQSSLQNTIKTYIEAGNYTVNLEVTDTIGLKRTDSINIEATQGADTTPPSTITSLADQSRDQNSIYWTWTNPTDTDFSHNIIFINNTNVGNTSNNYYNATGLSPESVYEIGIQTVDTSDNINTNTITDIAMTQGIGPDTTPPGTITNLDYLEGFDWIYWYWDNPADPDFSHNMIYIDSSFVINTSNNYHNATGLNNGTTYQLGVETVDTSNNINTTRVVSDATTLLDSQTPILDLDNYWIYTTIMTVNDFRADSYYPLSGIDSVLWDFGDGYTSSNAIETHYFSSTGEFNGNITINTLDNRTITEDLTFRVEDNFSREFESNVDFFTDSNAQAYLSVALFGEDGINGFVRDNGLITVMAVAKVQGDTAITEDQVRISGNPAQSCWALEGGYFKCIVMQTYMGDIVANTYDIPVILRNDASSTVASVTAVEVVEENPPNIILSVDETFKADGDFTFSIFIEDTAYNSVKGSGIGSVYIYEDGNHAGFMTTTQDNMTHNHVFSTTAIAAGEEKAHELYVNVSDNTRQWSSECLTAYLDKKAPAINSVEFSNVALVPRTGLTITGTANITDLSGPQSIAFSGIGNTTGESSCIPSGTEHLCSFDATIFIDQNGDYNYNLTVTDNTGNTAVHTDTLSLFIDNSNPILSIDDITVDEGDLITINPSSTDADGDTVTYTYSGWMTSDTYQTTNSDQGSHQVTVTADDGHGGTDEKTITITVNNVPLPDLEVSDFSYTTSNPSMLRYVITNIGEAKATDVEWSVVDSQAEQVSQQTNSFDLEIGEDVVIYAMIRYASSGTYNPALNADPNNVVTELDETNNQLTPSVTI